MNWPKNESFNTPTITFSNRLNKLRYLILINQEDFLYEYTSIPIYQLNVSMPIFTRNHRDVWVFFWGGGVTIIITNNDEIIIIIIIILIIIIIIMIIIIIIIMIIIIINAFLYALRVFDYEYFINEHKDIFHD